MKLATKIIEPSDKLIADLTEHAKKAIKGWQRNSGMTPRVMFKHTCGECGQRGFVDAPNTVPANVECERCANVEPYERGGYSLAFELVGTSPHGFTDSATREVKFATPEHAKVNKAAPSTNPKYPVKIGCRMNPDQSITPVDLSALAQFGATCEAQERKVNAKN